MADEWKQVSDLYHAALKLPENERAAFLKACIASDGVRREVASLLANETAGDHLMESPALEVAAGMMNDNAPVLTIGQTLGHYQIKSQLGKGGMGEVYRAQDQKLGRDVAIKTLPPEFARDPDRVARFNREAKLLASLNHPNIAAIYGLEESGGTSFLVLELAEGDTLADRIKSGPIPVEESLKPALQIAEALEAAHEKGVIHRDLKPANINITPDGKVKVLDFGLAKAFAGEAVEMNISNSPTLSDMATQRGVILGTAAYMSPEQARGKPVDKRADIWAFGCVLFEMLTGRAAFFGNDATDILAAVIRSEPDWSKLPASLHWRIRELLERCLEKEVRDRCSGISDARVEIQKALANPNSLLVQKKIAESPKSKLRPGLSWIAAIVILGAIITGVAVWELKPMPPPEPRRVTRFEHYPAEDQQLSSSAWPILAVSPDGRQFVYRTNKGLCLRSLDKLDTRLVLGAAEDTLNPFFSPDGQWIGYWSLANNKLKKVAINGGTPVALCDAANLLDAGWDSDSAIIYTEPGKGIMRISADGGTPETLIGSEKENLYHPRLLPGGKFALFSIATNEGYKIVVQSLESRERKVLLKGDCAWYVPTGHIVYTLGNNIYAVPFRPDTFQIGKQVLMVEGVFQRDPLYPPQYAVSMSGTLAYVPLATATASQKRTLVWVDRNGKEEPLAAIPTDDYRAFKISPDGTRAALTVKSGSKSDIWICDLAGENRTRLTFNEGSEYPLWTLDGKRIAFASIRGGLMSSDVYLKAADGMGEEEKIGTAPDRSLYPWSWSSDGKTLILMDQPVFGEVAATMQSHIGELPIDGGRKWKLLLQEKYYEAHPQISPDGRWLAYTSGDSFYQSEIYVRPFPEVNAGKWQVSTGGGKDPLWSHDGRELFYRNGNSVIAVTVQTEPGFEYGKPKVIFQGSYSSVTGHMWDLSRNDKRFLMMKEAGTAESPAGAPRKINIVLNWFEELKQRVPVK